MDCTSSSRIETNDVINIFVKHVYATHTIAMKIMIDIDDFIFREF